MITYDEVDHVVHLAVLRHGRCSRVFVRSRNSFPAISLPFPTQRTVLANEYPGTLYPKPDQAAGKQRAYYKMRGYIPSYSPKSEAISVILKWPQSIFGRG